MAQDQPLHLAEILSDLVSLRVCVRSPPSPKPPQHVLTPPGPLRRSVPRIRAPQPLFFLLADRCAGKRGKRRRRIKPGEGTAQVALRCQGEAQAGGFSAGTGGGEEGGGESCRGVKNPRCWEFGKVEKMRGRRIGRRRTIEDTGSL